MALHNEDIENVQDILYLSEIGFKETLKARVPEELHKLLLPYWLLSSKRSITHYKKDSLTIYINHKEFSPLCHKDMQSLPWFKMDTPNTKNVFVQVGGIGGLCSEMFMKLPHIGVTCDFGDTYGEFRFVTQYLTNQETRPTEENVNGSLYLPQCKELECYTDDHVITEIRDFFKDTLLPKLIIICGPSTRWVVESVFWEKLAKTTKVLIIGIHQLIRYKIEKILLHNTNLVNIMCPTQFVEVADIHTLNADLILFSPGAGTCADLLSRGTAPIAPIIHQTRNGIGNDKMSNAECIVKLEVGPGSVDLCNYEDIQKAIEESQTSIEEFKRTATQIRDSVLQETTKGIINFCKKYLPPEKSSGGSKQVKRHLYFKRRTAHNKRRHRTLRRRKGARRKQSIRSKKMLTK